MLDVHLDLPLEVLVISISELQLEVDEKSVVLVETEQLITVLLVGLEVGLERDRVASVDDVG